MSLASLALLGSLVSAVALALTMLLYLRAQADLDAVRRMELRYRAAASERSRFLAARTAIAEAATSTTDAVQLGSTITKAGHQAIADIPFGILGAIPGTRHRSLQVKKAHDTIAEAVYATIAGVSNELGRLSRRRLTGEGESGPPEPPTPPALPPG